MNIRHLLRHQINDQAWNACVANAKNGLPYAYTWYLDIVAPNWQGLVLGDYEAVMPLPVRRKWGISYVYQPFWVQQLGIFSSQTITLSLFQTFLQHLPKSLRYLDFYGNEGHSIFLSEKTQHKAFDSIKQQQRTNYLLPLNQSYKELVADFSKNTKRNLKKAQKFDLHIQPIKDAQVVVNFFKTHTGNRMGVYQIADYQTIQKIISVCQERKMALMYGIFSPEKELLATAFFIKSHHRLINLLPSSSLKGKQQNAMTFLLNHVIKSHAGTATLLDFEGSMVEGIARFYQGFGANSQTYPHIQINRLPKLFRFFKN